MATERQLSDIMASLPTRNMSDCELLAKDKNSGSIVKVNGISADPSSMVIVDYGDNTVEPILKDAIEHDKFAAVRVIVEDPDDSGADDYYILPLSNYNIALGVYIFCGTSTILNRPYCVDTEFVNGTWREPTWDMVALHDDLLEVKEKIPSEASSTNKLVADAPNDGAFYVRSSGAWIKIADATSLIIEGYPIENADEFELVGKFNGNFYGKVEVSVTGTITIGLWNVATLEYDKEDVIAEGTSVVLVLDTRNAEYELHAKGTGSIESAIAKN